MAHHVKFARMRIFFAYVPKDVAQLLHPCFFLDSSTDTHGTRNNVSFHNVAHVTLPWRAISITDRLYLCMSSASWRALWNYIFFLVTRLFCLSPYCVRASHNIFLYAHYWSSFSSSSFFSANGPITARRSSLGWKISFAKVLICSAVTASISAKISSGDCCLV